MIFLQEAMYDWIFCWIFHVDIKLIGNGNNVVIIKDKL